MKQYFVLFLFIGLFSSCSHFAYNRAIYNYEYLSFAKKLDYKNGTYLLAPTSFEGLHSEQNLDEVYSFFKSKLKNRVPLANKLKDSNNKLIFSFPFEYDNELKYIDFIADNCNCDYLILTKVTYLKDSKDTLMFSNHKKISIGGAIESGARSSIKVIDVKSKKIILEMGCSAYISIYDTSKFNLYSNHKTLGEKAIKKMLKKLK